MAAAGRRRDQVAKRRNTQDDLNIDRFIGMRVEGGGVGRVDGDGIHDAIRRALSFAWRSSGLAEHAAPAIRRSERWRFSL